MSRTVTIILLFLLQVVATQFVPVLAVDTFPSVTARKLMTLFDDVPGSDIVTMLETPSNQELALVFSTKSEEEMKLYISDLQKKALVDRNCARLLGWIYQTPKYKDLSKSFKFNEMAGVKGDGNAAFSVAMDYKFGEGVKQDYQKAISWFELADKYGRRYAKFEMVSIYMEKQQTKRMPEKAFCIALEQAEAGNTNAANWISCALANPELIRDPKRAFDFAIKACNDNNSALFHLAKLVLKFVDSLDTTQSEQVFQILNNESTRKVADVQGALGLMRLHGIGTKQEKEAGLNDLRMAADQGCGEASFALSNFYFQEKNKPECFRYMKLAAAQRNKEACCIMLVVENKDKSSNFNVYMSTLYHALSIEENALLVKFLLAPE